MPVRVVNWNVEWKAPGSRAGTEMRARIDTLAPDVVCLTEGYLDFLPADGFLITAEADYGYPILEGRRKVMLWSRHPWSNADRLGDPVLPGGRFISGTTETPVGRLNIVGVCVPWARAHVTTGRQDRKPWQDHRAYLDGLATVLPALLGRAAIVVGDYNQTLPRTRAPKDVHNALRSIMTLDLQVATAGIISGVDKLTIDHLAHTRHLQAVRVESISNIGPDGRQLSDHFGMVVDLEHC